MLKRLFFATLLATVLALPAHALTCVMSPAVTSPAATISWTPSTTRTDGTPIVGPTTISIYRSTSAAGPFTLLTTVPSSPSSYVDSTITNGASWYYEGTEVDLSGVASADTNVACKTFQAAPPNAPVITVAQAGGTAFQAYHGPTGAFLMRTVGTVAAGTSCDGANGIICVGQLYYAVPLSSITWAKAPQPAPVYAICA